MAKGEMKISQEAAQGQKCHLPYIPARYVFAIVLLLGSFMNMMLRASLPISMTAMVRRNVSSAATHVEGDTCPGGPTQQDPSNMEWIVTGEFDWDEVTQNTILTASTYGVLASTLIGGRLSELWSTKYMFAACYTVSAIVYILLPVTADWSVVAIIVFQAISGLFSGPLQPVMMSLCASWIPAQERQQLYGIIISAVNLGTIASGLLTGNLVAIMGWRFVFYLFASLVIAWTSIWMIFVYDSPDHHPRISEEERIFINENTKKDHAQAASRLPLKEILLSVPVWAHIAMIIPGAWMSATLSNALPTYLMNILHYDTATIGYISAIPPLATWISIIFFGFSSQWLRKKQYMSHLWCYHVFNCLATIVPAVILVCIPAVGCNAAAIISMLTLVSALNAAYIGGSQLNQMDIAINYTGTLVGMAATVSSAIQIVAPMITGVLTNNKQTLAAWSKVFYVAAGVMVVPFFIYLFFGSVKEQPWNRIQQEEPDKPPAVDAEAQTQKKNGNDTSECLTGA